MSGKYCKKLLVHTKLSARDACKTASKRSLQKTAEATGDKIAKRITKASKNSQQNNLETVANENDKEIP